jgi:general secretion pathway protein D
MSTYLVKSLNIIASITLLTACDFIRPIYRELPPPLPEAPNTSTSADPQPNVQAPLTKSHTQVLAGLPEREWQALTPEISANLKLPDQPVTINIDAMPLNDFIHLALGDILGLSFELDASVALREDPVTLHVTEPLKARPLLDMVEQALRAYDVFLAWSPEGLRVLPITKAASSAPQVLSENAKMLLKLGRAMTVIPLRYASPNEAIVFVRHFMDTGTVGDVSVDTRLNALIVIGMPDRIAAYQQAIQLIDRPGFANKKLTLIRPVYWQAEPLAKLLTEFLQAQSIPVSKTGSEYGAHLMVVEPINAIVVISPEQTWTNMINSWLESIDTIEAVGEENNTYVYFVKHSNAKGLGQVIGGILGNESSQNNTADSSESPMAASQFSSGTAGGTGNDFGSSTSSNAGGLGVGTGSSGLLGRGSGNSAKNTVDVVEGKGLRVIVDNERNALIFVGPSRAYRAAHTLLQQLDRVPRQVLIEATVADISLDKRKQLGVEWQYHHDDTANSGGTLATLGGLALATGGLSYAFINQASGIQAKLNALVREGSGKILSSPRLLTKDNEEASIQVGTQVAVLNSAIGSVQSGQSQTGQLNQLNSYRYVDTGVILKFTPTILQGGQVELKISQEVSAARDTGNTTTPIDKRQVQTVLVSDSGQTIMIGGLIKHDETLTETKVPFLGDLPLLGHLFNNEIRTDQITEMVVLITPHIVTSTADATYLTEAFQNQLDSEKIAP